MTEYSNALQRHRVSYFLMFSGAIGWFVVLDLVAELARVRASRFRQSLAGYNEQQIRRKTTPYGPDKIVSGVDPDIA